MGVRGLLSLAMGDSSLWRPLRGDERPHLVIDGGSFKFAFCKKFDFGLRHGGDYRQLRKVLESFLQQLAFKGWEVTFVMDGAAMHEFKDRTCTERAQAGHEQADRLARGVANGDENVRPLLSGCVFNECLEAAGARTVVADLEADLPAAVLARRLSGFVVSNDSDMLLMDTPGFIQVDHFVEFVCEEIEGMLVLEPHRLWHSLGLGVRDLAVFAGLSGNDFVDHSELQPWHRMLRADHNFGMTMEAYEHRSALRLVASFIRACRGSGRDPLEEGRQKIPQSCHAGLDYTVEAAYSGTFDEAFSELQIYGRSLEGHLLAQFRGGRLPTTMVSLALGQPMMLPPLLEPSAVCSGWVFSRPLRAAAAALVPGPVVERARADRCHKVAEGTLSAPALKPPFTDWPFGLEGLSEEDARSYFHAAVDWERMEQDWGPLPPHAESLKLPVAAMRYVILQNAELQEDPLVVTWPTVATCLLQLCLSAEARGHEVERLEARVGAARKVTCPEELPFLAAYQGALWSVFLLNRALGEPYEQPESSDAYDGPFLHAVLRALRLLTAEDELDGLKLDEKGRAVLLVGDILGTESAAELFRHLLSVWERSLEEIGAPFCGKASHRKMKFTMPEPQKPRKKQGSAAGTADTSTRSSKNRFAALKV